MEPRIIINSLPKAGTNLVAKLLDLAGMQWNHVCFDSRLILRAKPWTRVWRKVSQCWAPEVMVGIGAPVSVPVALVEGHLERLAPGQFIKAHVGYTSTVVRLAEKHSIVPIVVIRDPRDVIVSQVHYILNTERHVLHRAFKELGDLKRCFDFAIDGGAFGRVLLEDIRTRCLSLDPWLQSPRSIVVRFEDLVGERGGGLDDVQLSTISSVFRRAGIQVSPEETSRIASELHGPGKKTFRKGKIAEAWKELTPEQVGRMDAVLSDVYSRWGYEPSGVAALAH